MKDGMAGIYAAPWRMAWAMGGIYLLAVTVSKLVIHRVLSREQAEFGEWAWYLATAVLLVWFVRRDLAAAQRRRDKQQELLRWLSIVDGQDFFTLMTQKLARAVEADCALVCELTGARKEKLRSLAACCHGRQLEGFECAWAGTPGEMVLRERRLICYPHGLREQFPLPQLPPELAAESFLGTPLFDAAGCTIGLLALLDAKPLCDREGMTDILSLFAVRAAAELERRQAEEERARLAAIVDFSDDAIVGKTLDGIITNWNLAAEQLYGYTADEVIGRPASMLVPPDQRDEIPQLLAGIRRGEHFRHYPTERLRRDGRRIPISLTLSPIADAAGEIIGASAIARDISEQRETEKALRESEERFRATFDQAAVGIGHVALDGRWLRINRRYCDILGYTTEELKALTIADITHPDDRETTLKHFRLLREGAIESYTLEKRYFRKDGSTVWVNLTVSRVADADGRPRFFVGVVEDITTRKEAQQALRFSEARYRTLYHDNPTMIATLDADWTMLTVNPACVGQLGYGIEELEGQSVLKLFHPDDRPAVAEQLRSCLRNPDQVYRWQLRKVRKDGEVLWVEELAQAMYDLRGAVNLMVVCQDITARKRAEEENERLHADLLARAAELEDANRDLEAFNYAVAHDLRKPLTTVNGYCQILKEHCGNLLNEQCNGYLQEAYEATLRMNSLIDTLLDFSRLTGLEPLRQPFDFSGLAQRVAEELRLAEPERRVTFRILPGIMADGDASLLKVVIENLLDNAWKYTGKQMEAIIEFGRQEMDGQQIYFVRDNGSGFDMAHVDNLFRPFQRLPGTEEINGHGIGLATVERILRHHGGRIWAEGAPGQGATFYFTLAEP